MSPDDPNPPVNLLLSGRSTPALRGVRRQSPQSTRVAIPRVNCRALLAACLTLALSIPSPNHLFGARQNRLRNRQAQRLGRLEIDHQLVVCRLLDREVGRFGALEDLIDVARGVPIQSAVVWSIRHQAPGV